MTAIIILLSLLLIVMIIATLLLFIIFGAIIQNKQEAKTAAYNPYKGLWDYYHEA